MWACHRFSVDIYFYTMKRCQAPVAIQRKRQVTPARRQSAFSTQHSATETVLQPPLVRGRRFCETGQTYCRLGGKGLNASLAEFCAEPANGFQEGFGAWRLELRK